MTRNMRLSVLLACAISLVAPSGALAKKGDQYLNADGGCDKGDKKNRGGFCVESASVKDRVDSSAEPSATAKPLGPPPGISDQAAGGVLTSYLSNGEKGHEVCVLDGGRMTVQRSGCQIAIGQEAACLRSGFALRQSGKQQVCVLRQPWNAAKRR